MSLLGAIDIGGTSVKVGVVKDGTVLRSESISIDNYKDTPHGAAALLDDICQLIRQMEAMEGCPIKGVGIVCAGLVDCEAGTIIASPNLDFLVNEPLAGTLCAAFGVRVTIENDAMGAAIAEYLYGGWGTPHTMIAITLGTGVGGGIIANGNKLLGASGKAAEFGHIKVSRPASNHEKESGRQGETKARVLAERVCGCGAVNCLESYVGRDGILRTANELQHSQGSQFKWTNVQELANAANDGNDIALEAFYTTGSILGGVLANLIETLNPDRIVFSGGISRAFKFMGAAVTSEIRTRCSFESTRVTAKIGLSERPNESGLLGAAAAFEMTIKDMHSGNHMMNQNPQDGLVPLALCLHIGASSYGGAIMTADGDCVLSIKELGQSNRRDQPYDNFIDESRQAVEHLLLHLPNGYSQEQIVACGVVVPVPVPEPREKVGLAPSLKGLSASKLTLSLTKMLEEVVGRRIPVELENDGNATCLAEMYFGAAKGLLNYIALRLCTGVGCGIVINGQLLRGTRGFAGELGHQTAIQNGDKCTCGSRGCVETVASGKFLLNAARTKFKHNFKSYLDVIEQSVDGRIDMADQFHQIGSHLGAAVSSVANLLDPEKIIISGPMIRAYDLFKDAFAARWKPFPEIQPKVVVTNLDEQSESLAALAVLKYHKRLVANGDQTWPTPQVIDNSQ